MKLFVIRDPRGIVISATFRAGVIGEWRHRFDQSTLDAFQGSIGAEPLSAYGYGS